MEEFQNKITPPLSLSPLSDEKNLEPIAIHPLLNLDVRTPDDIKKQIDSAKKTAEYFKNHWTWFYVAAAIALYRTWTATKVNAAIFRIDRKLNGKDK